MEEYSFLIIFLFIDVAQPIIKKRTQHEAKALKFIHKIVCIQLERMEGKENNHIALGVQINTERHREISVEVEL